MTEKNPTLCKLKNQDFDVNLLQIQNKVCAKSKPLKITQDIRQNLNAEITEKKVFFMHKKVIQRKKNQLHWHLGQITDASELIITRKNCENARSVV